MPRKKHRGTVDRVEEGIVVVVINDPDDPEEYREVYIEEKHFKKRTPKSGDKVSIETD
jgi:hypothetical protein